MCGIPRPLAGRFLCPGVPQRSERALARLGRWLRRRLRGPRSKLESLRNGPRRRSVSRLPNLASVICDSSARLQGHHRPTESLRKAALARSTPKCPNKKSLPRRPVRICVYSRSSRTSHAPLRVPRPPGRAQATGQSYASLLWTGRPPPAENARAASCRRGEASRRGSQIP